MFIPAPLEAHSSGDEQGATLPESFEIRHCPASEGVAQTLASLVEQHVGWQCPVVEDAGDGLPGPSAAGVRLCTDPVRSDLRAIDKNSDEAYHLEVSSSGVCIVGTTAHGLFNGCMSFLQMLPATPPAGPTIALPAIVVRDAPRFGWRGVLLDTGRHYFSVEFLKRVLDACALHKINRFHWHLTEDQGWRIEIKRYPRLTEVGAWREGREGKPYGGFYTQEEVREVVAYAQERHITVVPEIELPGHCCAALASYPDLSCTGKVATVPNQWGVHSDVYCAGNEEVFEFLRCVLEEVCELFPSPWVHIGGDECPKVAWSRCERCQARIRDRGLSNESELQSWFIWRASQILAALGRRLIGWDEILEGGLVEGATVMSWRGVEGGVHAARMGHDVIMTPTSHCYLDYRQDTSPDGPGAWYAILPLEACYLFDPVPRPAMYGVGGLPEWCDTPNMRMWRALVFPEDTPMDAEAACHVLGSQANLWTEYVPDEPTAEYMLFPRLCALAESFWSDPARKDWASFRARMARPDGMMARLAAMGFRPRPLDEEAAAQPAEPQA
ncbi:unnamed protein product [Pedinophyceae sp. YPF-701]|nr:unnamed protein product [Pedinophyceae sp. YPF-701]